MKMAQPGERGESVIKRVLLGTQDAEDLARLTQKWKCSETTAIRRAIHEMVGEVVPAGMERRSLSSEQLRQAAEKARDYYNTDPEAKELAEFVGEEPSGVNHSGLMKAAE